MDRLGYESPGGLRAQPASRALTNPLMTFRWSDAHAVFLGAAIVILTPSDQWRRRRCLEARASPSAYGLKPRIVEWLTP